MGARHLARYRVLCPDRCCRHGGCFRSLPAAVRYANNPRCCRLGKHRIVKAVAWGLAA
jgi:hypothetical protein